MNAAALMFEEGARDAHSEVQIGGFFDLLKRRAAAGGMELPESRRGPFDGVVKALHNSLAAVGRHGFHNVRQMQGFQLADGHELAAACAATGATGDRLAVVGGPGFRHLNDGVRQRQQNRKQFAGLQ